MDKDLFLPATAFLLFLSFGLMWAMPRIFKKPPPPSHADELRAKLAQAKTSHVDHTLAAKHHSALAAEAKANIAYLKQQINHEVLDEQSNGRLEPDSEPPVRGFRLARSIEAKPSVGTVAQLGS